MKSVKELIDEIELSLDDFGPVLDIKDVSLFLEECIDRSKDLVNKLTVKQAEDLSKDFVCAVFYPSIVIDSEGREVARSKQETLALNDFKVWHIGSIGFKNESEGSRLINVEEAGGALFFNKNKIFVFGSVALYEAVIALFYFKFTERYFNTILSIPNRKEIIEKAFNSRSLDVKEVSLLSNVLSKNYL